VACRHEQYKAGESCPDRYCQGRLYDTKKPNIFIQFSGQPILEGGDIRARSAALFGLQERYVASLPEGVSEKRYEASADVAIVMAK
jgi:transposase